MHLHRGIPRHWVVNSLFFLIIAAAAVWLKSFYSRAGSEDLGWTLRPTAWVAEAISGTAFSAETGAGWVSHDRRFVIAPACAGINFLIIAWLTAACSGVHRFKSAAEKSLWLSVSVISAFGLTVGANGLRVVLSILLYDTGAHIGPLTPDRLHRVAGASVYLICLYLFHSSISWLSDRWAGGVKMTVPREGRISRRDTLRPLVWYLAIALGVPLLNAAYRRSPGQFLEHAGTVLAVGLGIFALISAAQWGCHRVRKRLRSAHTIV
jgi:exosortase K